LQVGVGLLSIRQVQLTAAVGLGPDHGIQASVLTGSGQLHVQPVDVFGSGQADQGSAAGQPLGAVASRRVGQVDPAVALAAAAAIQI